MKTFKAIVILCGFFFWSCTDQNQSDKENATEEISDIEVELETKTGYGNFWSNREVLFPVDEPIDYKGVPDEIETYVVRQFVLQKDQKVYQDFKTGKIDEEDYQEYESIFGIDSTSLSKQPIKTSVLILIGTHQSGDRAIVVDANQNNDFSDDELHQLEYPIDFIDEEDEEFFENEIHQFLPTIELETDFVVDGTIKKLAFAFQPNPYEDPNNFNFSANDSLENKYFLSVSSPFYKTGTFQLADQTYEVQLANDFLSPLYLRENTTVQLKPIQQDSTQSEEKLKTRIEKIPYKFGEILNIDFEDFKLESTSITGNSVLLKHKGRNEQPSGVKEGFFMPAVEFEDFDGTKTAVLQDSTEYSLLYFWTTWSTNSLKNTDDIKLWKSQLENPGKITILGVAVDANLGAAKRMEVRRKMNWKNLYIDESKPSGLEQIQQLKLDSYPVFILLDKEGKILRRTHHFKEIEKEFSALTDETI
ncbi:MAG: TlpA family protein disulfide reductase [Bacteroidota bacterium]